MIYRMHAIIGRSWLEAALEYKPYIKPKVTKWDFQKNWYLEVLYMFLEFHATNAMFAVSVGVQSQNDIVDVWNRKNML